jgi:riboflavin synthase
VRKAERKGGDLRLSVDAPKLASRVRLGDSVAVNGCCLTAVEVSAPNLIFQAVPETLSRTTLGSLREGFPVNLELPLTLSEPLGGHFVQGHVDGVAKVVSAVPEGGGVRMTVELPEAVVPYVIEKGSIALDGVSLTVAAIHGGDIEVALIPHTLENTNLGTKKAGDPLHAEADLLAKYVEKLSSSYQRSGSRP